MTKEEKIKRVVDMLKESTLTNYRIGKDTNISANQINRYRKGLNVPNPVYGDVLYKYLSEKMSVPEEVEA